MPKSIKKLQINDVFLVWVWIYFCILFFWLFVGLFEILWLDIDKLSYGDLLNAAVTFLTWSVVAYIITNRHEKNKLEKDILYSEISMLKNELSKLSELLKEICFKVWDLCENSNEDLAKLLLAYISRLDNITSQIKSHTSDSTIFTRFTNFRKFINPIHNNWFQFDAKFYADFLKECTIFEEAIRELDHKVIK